MTTTTATTATRKATWSTKNKVGLGLAAFYALVNLPSAVLPSGEPGEDGPPLAILVLCSILAAAALVASVVAWRTGSRPAARLAAASLIVVTLTSLPAFFVDVPALVKVLVAAGVLYTILMVVLMFSPPKRA